MFTYTITSFDRKIKLIQFLRAVTNMRDGRPVGLRDAKVAADRLEANGVPIVVVNVPNDAAMLINMAAANAGINRRDPDLPRRTTL